MSKKTVDEKNSDKVIGSAIRLARKTKRLSQGNLGKILGVTYQQIQKYEKGKNCISALKLYRISRELGFPLEFFFELEAHYANKY